MSAPGCTTARVAPADAPFSPAVQAMLEKTMPAGVAPLALFTTLARDARLFARFMGGGLLDRGHLTLRQREIIIHRVTGRCGSEYEWGVHAAFFAERVGLDDAALAATLHDGADASCWSADEALLIQLCDRVLSDCDVSDELWVALRDVYDEMALLEMLMLVGFYRTVSTLTNALRLPLEVFGRRFGSVAQNRTSTAPP